MKLPSRSLPPAGAIVLCVLAWVAAYFIIDIVVQQAYPLPSRLSANTNMVDIIASRPEAAVALNVLPDLVVLATLAFVAARPAAGRAPRHGMILTGIVLALWITSAWLVRNPHWTNAVAIALAAPVGFGAARWGGRTIRTA